MKKVIYLAVVCVMAVANFASADTFGTGGNTITIDFVPISGSTNPTSGYGIVNNDYRMGTYEIKNNQWNKFKAAYGAVTGTPSAAYDNDTFFYETNKPTNNVSWYEAAQFVNYLNTSTNHQAAYKFTGTRGTSNYTLGVWESGDIGYNASNPYRNSNAYYFLPTEDEWVKAAYWNGLNLQTWATIGDVSPIHGNSWNEGWNYENSNSGIPWNVNSGSRELNGTYNMMGNVFEWNETLIWDSRRVVRGGSAGGDTSGVDLTSSSYRGYTPDLESGYLGFRVASVPEPASALLMLLGAAWMGAKRKR